MGREKRGKSVVRLDDCTPIREEDEGEEEDENDTKEEDRYPESFQSRQSDSLHFGDYDFELPEEAGEATWREVYYTCCCHTPVEWLTISLGLAFVCFFLYWFLFALELLGASAKVMSGCRAGTLYGDNANPIACVVVGILSTVLLQSSSTTTSIIVSLVGTAISVSQGIYMVMGANIGTTVTNTIIAIGQIGDADQLERAFAGATVHDMFNYMTLAALLPLEVVTGYLEKLTAALVRNVNKSQNGTQTIWQGPIKKYVAPLGDRIIMANSALINGIAQGNSTCSGDNGYYPIICEDHVVSYENCVVNGRVGLITCSSHSGCPLFFNQDASAQDDKVSGGVAFFFSIILLFICLMGVVAILQRMIMGVSTRIVYKATDVNGYLSLAIGAGITMITQSSSITTSTLTPLVGIGALRLEQMYPLTIGSNLGASLTAILAALVTEGTLPLQVAMAYLFFNITGICIWYPIPYMRSIPLHSAKQLGKAAHIWRGFPFFYIIFMFFLLPLMMLGVSLLFENGSKGFTALGTFVLIVLGLLGLWLFVWCRCQEGRRKCIHCLKDRDRRSQAIQSLPDDMEYVMAKLSILMEHTGLPDDDGEDDEEEEEVDAKDDDKM